jgi:putative MATE family efflux protein
MPDKNILDNDRIGGLLLKLSIPAFFGHFVMTMYNIVNTIFISRNVGPLGIAGLSIVFPLQMLCSGIGQMTGMGGASSISRLIGERNIPRAEKVLGNAITLSFIVSILITVIGFINVDYWLRLMGASETILPYARDYMIIILAGTVFSIFAISFSSLLIAEGNTRVSMIGMIIGALLNIALCAVFIFLLGWGIKGSAIAAVLSQITTVAFYLWYYFSGKALLKILPANFLLEWSIVRAIFVIGVSSFIRTLAGSLSAIVVNRVLITLGGDMVVSAFGLINRVMMFAAMPGMIIGQGLQPILGYNYGARNFDRIFRAMRLGFIVSTVFSILAFIVLQFIPGPIISIFTSDKELTDLAVNASKLVFLGLPFIGSLMVGSVVFQALGKAVPAFVTSLARPAIFLMPCVFILSRFLLVNGVWLSFAVTDVLTCLLTVLFLVFLIKQLQKMRKTMADTVVISHPAREYKEIKNEI